MIEIAASVVAADACSVGSVLLVAVAVAVVAVDATGTSGS